MVLAAWNRLFRDSQFHSEWLKTSLVTSIFFVSYIRGECGVIVESGIVRGADSQIFGKVFMNCSMKLAQLLADLLCPGRGTLTMFSSTDIWNWISAKTHCWQINPWWFTCLCPIFTERNQLMLRLFNWQFFFVRGFRKSEFHLEVKSQCKIPYRMSSNFHGYVQNILEPCLQGTRGAVAVLRSLQTNGKHPTIGLIA